MNVDKRKERSGGLHRSRVFATNGGRSETTEHPVKLREGARDAELHVLSEV